MYYQFYSILINNLKVKTALKLITLTLMGLLNAEIITVTLGLNVDTFHSKNLFFSLFPLSETVFVARKSQRFIKNINAKQQRDQKALFNWSSHSKMVKIPRTCNAYYIEQGHVIAIANFFLSKPFKFMRKKISLLSLGYL